MVVSTYQHLPLTTWPARSVCFRFTQLSELGKGTSLFDARKVMDLRAEGSVAEALLFLSIDHRVFPCLRRAISVIVKKL
eukprot:1951375-Pleurochrysis_carterae.AAC.1